MSLLPILFTRWIDCFPRDPKACRNHLMISLVQQKNEAFRSTFMRRIPNISSLLACPELHLDQISIDLLTQAVTISANHVDSLATQHKTQGMFQKDLSASRLSRTISFPKPINERKVTARHRDGILTLHLPKVKGNRIEIND